MPYIYQQQKGHTNIIGSTSKSERVWGREEFRPPPPTATTPAASGASHITTLVVVYLLLPKRVFVLHFLTLKGKGGELYLV